MPRYLTAALLCEGKEDAAFLCAVIRRQIDRLGCAEIESVRPEGQITANRKSEEVDEVLLEIAPWYDVIFVHNDWNEREKASALCDRVHGLLPEHLRLVRILPKRETEAWPLADPSLFPKQRRDGLPPRAADVESQDDPKIPLQRALGCPYNEIDAEEFGENVSLDRLAEVPAYRSFLQDLTAALKELNFL
jgi:hypothetical protein